MTSIDRALALAKARGIKTGAKTITGILRSLRGSRSGVFRSRPAVASASRECSIAALISGYDQGRARERLIDRHEPLRVALSALAGHDSIETIAAVPNRYRYAAQQSAASAVRRGQAILIECGRYDMPHTSYGMGGRDIIPTGRQFIRARTLSAALPALPAGWRIGADDYGAYVLGPGFALYHPTGADFADVITRQSWDAVMATAIRQAELRRAQSRKTREDRRARLFARLSDACAVTRNDARAVGMCDVGIVAWCAKVGISDDTDAMPAREILRLAEKSGEPRAVAAAIHAARKFLSAHQEQ